MLWLLRRLAGRYRSAGCADCGYSTEAVVITALLAALALGALAVISDAVMDRAQSITLEQEP